jgi:exodeoxyribonuclease V alpha subunit
MQNLSSDLVISADLVVVDEASMLDPLLMLHLFNAIGERTRLLLLGDPDQLPPVEGGSLFPELAHLFGQRLTRSMRMGEGPLYDLSQAILKGEKVESEPIDSNTLIDRLVDLFPEEGQKKFRILCALRQGPIGVDAINKALMDRYKGSAVPILITQNDPKQQLYNGTTGVLIRKVAYFDGLEPIPVGKLPRYELAFCLSVHKSQGSEYDEVIAIFGEGSERFGREALYTAVTRAKKSVRLWIDPPTLEALLKSSSLKRSGFTERFKGIT